MRKPPRSRRKAPAVSQVVSRSPRILGGTPVFAGTRVPVQTLLDYLEGGERIDDFLEDFPTVSRRKAVGLLELARQRFVSRARAP